MKVSGQTTPWFRTSLGDEGRAEVAAAEPADARLYGITSKDHYTYTATISRGSEFASGTGTTAIAAYRRAYARFTFAEVTA